jgi:hypothetical protein
MVSLPMATPQHFMLATVEPATFFFVETVEARHHLNRSSKIQQGPYKVARNCNRGPYQESSSARLAWVFTARRH